MVLGAVVACLATEPNRYTTQWSEGRGLVRGRGAGSCASQWIYEDDTDGSGTWNWNTFGWKSSPVPSRARTRCWWIGRSMCLVTIFARVVLTLNVRGPSYLGLTRSISWLLLPWLLMSPGHQQPWYWLCRICRSWSYLRKGLIPMSYQCG